MSEEPGTSQLSVPEPLLFDQKLWRRRSIRDLLARYLVGAGGVAVIGSIILIFLFLFAVVFPLFKGANLHEVTTYQLSHHDSEESLLYSIEEQAEIGMRLNNSGVVQFFSIDDGKVLDSKNLLADSEAKVVSWTHVDPEKNILGLGLDNGTAIIFRHEYASQYANDKRTIVPSISYPYGEAPINLEVGKQAISNIAISGNEDGLTFFGQTESGPRLIDFTIESSFLDEDEFSLELTNQVILPYPDIPLKVLVSPERQWLYLLNAEGAIAYYDIRNKAEPLHIEDISVLYEGSKPAALEFLLGGISLLLADDQGNIHQLFLVRGENNKRHLTAIRKFKSGDAEISSISTEILRKGFLVTDVEGNVSLFHSTASRHLFTENISDKPITHFGVAPRSDKIIAEDASGQLHVWKVDSEHPEASLSSIWGKVWYESYPEPDYIWQSSSASSDFEPKFSLTPLTFGTFKAAFYAMLLAMPLAICGAIFTAYFMAPKMRGVVKPSIEIMEALPTVILGFLAGLWLAPFVEAHLPGVFATLVALPLGILIASFLFCFVDGWL